MFITFEGIEGSGKSTQIRLLTEELIRRGHEVVQTREPGGTVIGDHIRKILLDSSNKNMGSRCEMLLYAAARAQHVDELIIPSLNAGKIVLCDRYVDSTIAYQGYARGLDLNILENLRQWVAGSVPVNKTLLFDLSAEEGLQRAKGRISLQHAADKEDRFENEKIEFHKKVRTGFLALARKEPARFVTFDATLDKMQLHAQVLKTVEELLRETMQ